MRVTPITFLSLTAALFLVGNLDAQSDSGTRTLCLSAHPSPTCRLFLLTNFGAYARLDAHTIKKDRLAFDWGAMINVSPRDAIGASVYASVDLDGASENGPAVRYRRWFGPRSALDVGVGLGTVRSDNQNKVGQSAYATVKFSPAPWIGLAIRQSDLGTLVGVEFGSTVGSLLTLAACAAGGVALVVALASSFRRGSGGRVFLRGRDAERLDVRLDRVVERHVVAVEAYHAGIQR